jgi:hypothetical protein
MRGFLASLRMTISSCQNLIATLAFDGKILRFAAE